MRRTTSLPALHKTVRKRVVRLRALAESASVCANDPDKREAHIAFCIVELQNTWTQFLRSFYLSCAVGTYDGSGGKVRANLRIGSEMEAIDLAVRSVRRVKPGPVQSWNWSDEPVWYKADHLRKASKAAGLPNLPDIEAVYATRDSMFGDLPMFRNYYAHRTGETMRAAQRCAISYGVSTSKRPTEILLSRGVGRHQPILLDWMDTVVFSAEFLCW